MSRLLNWLLRVVGRIAPRATDDFSYRRTVHRDFSVIQGGGWDYFARDVGRSDQGTVGSTVIELEPWPPSEISMWNTKFKLRRSDGATLEEIVPYSHRGLLKFCTAFHFESVLDVGSHEGHAARIFKFLGKRVTTTEILDCFEADHRGDYLDIQFPAQTFDAIWASHILEHQRNTGTFLDKLFHDLKDGGVLAVTVPISNPSALEFGHLNLYNPYLLLYQLFCAGFDCRNASVSSYNAMTTAIVRKVPNGITRTSFGQYPSGLPGMAKHHYFPALVNNFPFAVNADGRVPGYTTSDINW